MSDEFYQRWVRQGQRVDGVYSTGPGIHVTGKVIAYTDRPTLAILTDDGQIVSWIADLCVPAGPDEGVV